MLGSLRHCIPAANRGHRCHLRSNTTTSLLHVRYIRLYGPEPYALWLLSPPAASPLLPSPSPAVPDLQGGSDAGYPHHQRTCSPTCQATRPTLHLPLHLVENFHMPSGAALGMPLGMHQLHLPSGMASVAPLGMELYRPPLAKWWGKWRVGLVAWQVG